MTTPIEALERGRRDACEEQGCLHLMKEVGYGRYAGSHEDIPEDGDEAYAMGHRIMLDACRATRRAKALADMGRRMTNPPWSLSMPSAVADLLGRMGRRQGETAERSRPQTVAGCKVTLLSHKVGNGCYETGIEVVAPTCRFVVEGGQAMTVTFEGLQIPETMLPSLVGERLADVTHHPLIETWTAVIRTAERIGEKVVMRLEDRLIAAGAAPVGMDVSWLDLGTTR